MKLMNLTEQDHKESAGWFVPVLAICFLLATSIILSGCGMVNGAASDVENASRWIRERSQPAVDNMELRRIRSAVDTQTRIIKRGGDLTDAVR